MSDCIEYGDSTLLPPGMKVTSAPRNAARKKLSAVTPTQITPTCGRQRIAKVTVPYQGILHPILFDMEV